MIDGEVVIMKSYVHTKTNNEYIVLDVGQMKLGDGEWVDAVVYTRENKIFCRDLVKFKENFDEQ